MVTGAAFRKLALSFPDAHEEPHFERTSFRVGKKIFATMTGDGLEAMVKVAPIERVEALLGADPKMFFSYGSWTMRGGALGVRLPSADANRLKALLSDAWKTIAPAAKARAKRTTAKKTATKKTATKKTATRKSTTKKRPK
jgi:hypothetical protein